LERPRNILLVDDEEDFLETMARRLVRRGFEVRTATHCAMALPEVVAGWPQVVVLDVMLPDIGGMTCLSQIKQQAPRLPVIMLTGHASMHASLQGLEYGASDYCLKPIDLDELVEKLIIAFNDVR
jgi:two-component system, OmpR family, response regulator